MAIILLGKSECPICGLVLEEGDDFFGTPHFIHSGPLSRYSDAGMHRACFTAWPKADEFRLLFNEAGRSWPGGPRQMLPDGAIVKVSVEDLPARAIGKPRLTLGVLGIEEERHQLNAAIDAVEKRNG